MNAPSPILRFKGAVQCVAGPGRGGITLVGQIVEADGATTAAQLSLHCLEPAQLPPTLNDVTFQALTAPDMLLRSAAGEWPLRGDAWQLHRDVGDVFYAAIPPRVTPWARRLAWSAMLRIAANGPGRWLLQRLARAK